MWLWNLKVFTASMTISSRIICHTPLHISLSLSLFIESFREKKFQMERPIMGLVPSHSNSHNTHQCVYMVWLCVYNISLINVNHFIISLGFGVSRAYFLFWLRKIENLTQTLVKYLVLYSSASLNKLVLNLFNLKGIATKDVTIVLFLVS